MQSSGCSRQAARLVQTVSVVLNMAPKKRKSGEYAKGSAAKKAAMGGEGTQFNTASMPWVAQVVGWHLSCELNDLMLTISCVMVCAHLGQMRIVHKSRFEQTVMPAGGPDRYLSKTYPNKELGT